ncbi:MAG: tRNA (adenosine(37)-N6)-threonylcarbamoyltransferase complex dimerization subunit type 1 TsaB [Candidatus Caldatribacterium sp.]|uniref:tRNA (adenosine(37)-N6)-threonylcarbamoyltransferase complex dimerization subunit type 1 TsaB n=1 Tax=Candidatus Caldatribacterium sp. TaxID=2282143 RepID=UPI00299160BF|nr:tRNA (adenosine(37)-N6)-threonylcarbamoyltransferase complex dimerization subunit type 1 TsaB [Candidatus Caldatribacterium sp.]MCX7731392.1 tRNA (adenosine(37)-N6)-threonylcarbamoyltransferase complex dimerization subunit type 1 TsaB [Candidatus Caldatribacterium sp.]MDW8080898.1 tRNA (adenosine(37)-N6)-threonylcarbamoyltransferase complex dimerization subunit type 1 TsaB [Candidatus Calescibacterium sp.]
MILAFDTSTPWLGIALAHGRDLLFHVVEYTKANHSLLLMQYLELLEVRFALRKHLAGVVIGLGPGSFTGVKVGAILAKGLAYALQIPLGGFSTLEVLASSARRLKMDQFETVIPVIFHRKGEIFWSEFRRDVSPLLSSLQVGSPEDFLARYGGRRDVFIVTPWEDLWKFFVEAGFSCADPFLAIPDPLELILLFEERGKGSTENVFTLLPFYGSRVFERESAS